MGKLTVLDYAVVAGYLGLTLFIGVWVSRYIRTGREFFLAGRTLPWWAVGVSLVATDIGGTDLIGVGGAAYRYGLAVGNFEWIGCVPAMIVAAFVFIPHFWRCGITTIPEYLERRFDVRIRTAVAACWLVFMACNLGVMLLASAKLMEALAGWSTEATIALMALMVGFYTCSGGLAAVVYTDALQGVLMIAGCTLVVVIGLVQSGGPEGLRQKVATAIEFRATERPDLEPVGNPAGRLEHFDLILPMDTPSPFPWTGILFGLAFITSPAYWIGNQAIVQRTLGARSEFEAKASYVWGALLKNIIPLIIAVPGLIALAQFPTLADPDKALPTLIGTLMPAGVKGIFLAAFLAALMSSVDSYLNSATTIFTHDFYLRYLRPSADERRLLGVGRVMTVLLTAWGVLFAYILSRDQSGGGIYAIFQTLMAFFNGPAFAVLLAGLLTRSATSRGVLAGFCAGVATSITLYVLNRPEVSGWMKLPPLFQVADPFLYLSIWAFLVAVTVTVVVSYLTTADLPGKQGMSIWGPAGEATR
jgi:solute:Na+ symporter, SSS family